jgi:antitoxin ParD1/3/4
MPTTTTTQQFTITLPTDVVEIVRSKVSSGEYASESDFIEAAIVDSTLSVPVDGGLEHWIQTEGARRCAALDADPSSGLTLEETFADLDDDNFEEAAKPS